MSNNKKKVQVSKPKTFFMTQNEKMNLAGRDGMASQFEFLSQLIRKDMDSYVEDVIKPRNNIKGKATRYDIDQGIIQLIEMPEVKVNEEVRKDGKSDK